VQDAVNLGWKLAQVVHGTSSVDLLDTYHAERHPVGARVLDNTLAQVALGRGDASHLALRSAVGELLAMDEPRRRIAGMISALDVRYDLGDGHPLLGRRMPDIDLSTDDGPTRLFTLLHDARPLLLDLAGGGHPTPWSDHIRVVGATGPDQLELPVVGSVAPPAAVLVRPDGHVAWTGGLDDPQLPAAIDTWFGAGP
jgi:3-(3-hydroxy-phenyl)propionate hydroxylase